MKFPALLLILASALLPARAAEVTPPPSILAAAVAQAATADEAWLSVAKSFESKLNPDVPPFPGRTPLAVYRVWGLRYYASLYQTGTAFMERFPQDPRRWHVVLQMNDKSGWLRDHDEPEVARAIDALVSAELRAAWRARAKALAEEGLVATDTPAEVRLYFDMGTFYRMRGAASQAITTKQPVEFAAMRTELDRLIAKYPEEEKMGGYVTQYVGLKQKAGASADELEREWRSLEKSGSASVRKAVETGLVKLVAYRRFLDLKSRPLDIAFTAVDARAVDLKALRGKVVLVDFWATWCAPCKEEIPNIKKVYAAYHDKGFEVVGISLENAGLTLQDTPEQKEAKLAKAKTVLTAFTAANAMPWPQHFDGKFWKNDISMKYAITAIPAMFLLDQEGNIVTTDARGEKLEAEVKRLLGL